MSCPRPETLPVSSISTIGLNPVAFRNSGRAGGAGCSSPRTPREDGVTSHR